MMTIGAVDCEIIPLSPLPFADVAAAQGEAPASPQRLLARGNTLKGAFSTALRALSNRPAPRILQRTGVPDHETMLRCSDAVVAEQVPVYQGRPVNVSRAGRPRTLVTDAELRKTHRYLDVGVDSSLVPTITLGINSALRRYEIHDSSRNRIDDLVTACNRFYLRQFRIQVAELEARQAAGIPMYRFDRWLERMHAVWNARDIDRPLADRSGFLVRFGRGAGSEARSLNSAAYPRTIESKRSLTGRVDKRRSPKTWWMVAPAELPLPHGPDVQCAPAGWAFVRILRYRSRLQPAWPPTSGADAADTLDHWTLSSR